MAVTNSREPRSAFQPSPAGSQDESKTVEASRLGPAAREWGGLSGWQQHPSRASSLAAILLPPPERYRVSGTTGNGRTSGLSRHSPGTLSPGLLPASRTPAPACLCRECGRRLVPLPRQQRPKLLTMDRPTLFPGARTPRPGDGGRAAPRRLAIAADARDARPTHALAVSSFPAARSTSADSCHGVRRSGWAPSGPGLSGPDLAPPSSSYLLIGTGPLSIPSPAVSRLHGSGMPASSPPVDPLAPVRYTVRSVMANSPRGTVRTRLSNPMREVVASLSSMPEAQTAMAMPARHQDQVPPSAPNSLEPSGGGIRKTPRPYPLPSLSSPAPQVRQYDINCSFPSSRSPSCSPPSPPPSPCRRPSTGGAQRGQTVWNASESRQVSPRRQSLPPRSLTTPTTMASFCCEGPPPPPFPRGSRVVVCAESKFLASSRLAHLSRRVTVLCVFQSRQASSRACKQSSTMTKTHGGTKRSLVSLSPGWHGAGGGRCVGSGIYQRRRQRGNVPLLPAGAVSREARQQPGALAAGSSPLHLRVSYTVAAERAWNAPAVVLAVPPWSVDRGGMTEEPPGGDTRGSYLMCKSSWKPGLACWSLIEGGGGGLAIVCALLARAPSPRSLAPLPRWILELARWR
ncbi:hypothetical protein CDD83_10914 [Cordyceps sp. RAO-2017]|nr:hypothetical protein CDD83_10914 [Cordyceps sp. RAO-2017]